MITFKCILVSILLLSCLRASHAQKITTDKSALILSAVSGTAGKPDTVVVSVEKGTAAFAARLTGEHAAYFRLSAVPAKVVQGRSGYLVVAFEPPPGFTGVAHASLRIRGRQQPMPLTGLSTKGLEGENEAALQQIIRTLGYSTDAGWITLANNLNPGLQGDELAPALFKKAEQGNVEMIPVARYSPDFMVNFGYYTVSPEGPVQHQSGILAKAEHFPEHQTLFPALAGGRTSFDPGISSFGFYAVSPTHTVYSEDIWNILFQPSHAAHAVRVYPVRDNTGRQVANAYLVAIEEAANGDYNDYVFLVKNVTPVFGQEYFETLLNGKDFSGWYKWLQTKGKNNDPESIFTVESEGVVHDTGKELGYLMTERSFDNFHLILEFKWGEKKWPPRENEKRDSGICYNIPEDEADQIWPRSVECQVQEGDVGDFWLLGYSTIQVDGKQNPPQRHARMVKARDGEKPHGEWNRVEVISFHGRCVHLVNGVVVNYGENSSLTGGRILLQSEYAEIYYRNVRIREF